MSQKRDCRDTGARLRRLVSAPVAYEVCVGRGGHHQGIHGGHPFSEALGEPVHCRLKMGKTEDGLLSLLV